MSARAGLRAWLGAAVAVGILGGLTLVSLPHQETAAPTGTPAPTSGRPLGAITPAMPTTGAGRPDPRRAHAVGDLLQARADALSRRDEQAFLAGIDPTADADFVARQRALFANLDGVLMDEWSYNLHAEDAVDVSTMPASPGSP